MTNTELLKHKIKLSGLKKSYLAQRLNISLNGFSNKINGKTEFKANEISILCNELKLNSLEMMKIFFARKVDLKSINHLKGLCNQDNRLYRIWSGMKQRCYNPNLKRYKDYGGRGITVCDEWKTDFKAFYDWAVANGYQDDLSIDRIDNDKGYYPDNCRWATYSQQNINRRKKEVFM